MIRDILKLYYLFIDRWKHFGKHSEIFFRIVGIWVSLKVLGFLPDWAQYRFYNFKRICNVFYFRYLAWPTFLMKFSWTTGTQNLVVVTTVMSSLIGTKVIYTIKPIALQVCISCVILNLNYLSVICWGYSFFHIK